MNADRLAQFYKAGNYKEAWWAYKALAAPGECTWDVYQWGALTARALGRIHSAIHVLEQGMAVASGAGLGRLRFTHAVYTMELGQLDAAAEAILAWISDLPQYPGIEPVYVGMSYYHLGLIRRQQERFVESIRYYRTACEHLRRANQRAHLSLTLHNLAWVACLVGDDVAALAALDEALPLCETPELHWHQQIGRAFLLTVQRLPDLRLAMMLCEEIIDYQGDDLPHAVRSHAYWLAGRVALELDLGDTAQAMAEQALVSALGLGDERCVTDAYRLIAEVDSRFSVTEPDKSGLC